MRLMPERDDAAEDLARARRVFGLAPHVGARQAHRAEAEAHHLEVTNSQGRRDNGSGHGRSLSRTRVTPRVKGRARGRRARSPSVQKREDSECRAVTGSPAHHRWIISVPVPGPRSKSVVRRLGVTAVFTLASACSSGADSSARAGSTGTDDSGVGAIADATRGGAGDDASGGGAGDDASRAGVGPAASSGGAGSDGGELESAAEAGTEGGSSGASPFGCKFAWASRSLPARSAATRGCSS